jgi:hypothetical protein
MRATWFATAERCDPSGARRERTGKRCDRTGVEFLRMPDGCTRTHHRCSSSPAGIELARVLGDRSSGSGESNVANATVSCGARITPCAGCNSAAIRCNRTPGDCDTSSSDVDPTPGIRDRVAGGATAPATRRDRSARHGDEKFANATAPCEELVRYAIA